MYLTATMLNASQGDTFKFYVLGKAARKGRSSLFSNPKMCLDVDAEVSLISELKTEDKGLVDKGRSQ